MSSSLVIVNTGCANISSVKFAFERLGVQVDVSDDVQVIAKANRVLLPGVGSAPAAMSSINRKALSDCLRSLTQPTLGVCLGMQLMVTDSEEGEFGKTDLTNTLGLIPGRVKRMQVGNLRLPHMGWNRVTSKYENPLFAGIPDGEHFYFVHSFAIEEYEHTLATCHYASGKAAPNGANQLDAEQIKADIGMTFSAAIHKDNFFGVQFHPERSSDAGAQLLKNFIQL
ncbi:imidazole glycerol phosphate synthase subunit HisH [Glaciecola sp. MF2-115]|uniref:imidazole glycerol phosphate synthase subunit HisH n=1 Tax=Glaciecola sp. MF2-115 TaxID=3384827 RepID=UPI0039A1F661